MADKRSKRFQILFNALGFNAVWWLCVFGTRWEMPWLGPLLMALFLTIHLRWLSRTSRELYFVLIAALLGTLVDSIKAVSGFIQYDGGYGLAWLAPAWITAMWAGFSALLNHSLRWLRGRYWLAALLGAVFGPPAYLTGVKFGVLQFGVSDTTAIVILALVWGTAVPVLLLLSEQVLGRRHAVQG